MIKFQFFLTNLIIVLIVILVSIDEIKDSKTN